MDINKMKRNELDILLTDLLPVEVSNIFTLSYFYEFLMTKRKKLKNLDQELKKLKFSGDKLLFEGWHATPFKYKVNKGNGNGELREIAIPNPLSLMQIFFFIKLYNEEIIDKLRQNSHFSLRYHDKNNDLFYKSNSKGLVKYEDDSRKKDKLTKVLESSGIFYEIKPYSMLTNFYDSEQWFKLNNQFQYFAKIDYKDCFGSIYTHTFKWIISNNTIDSRGFRNNHLYSVIDRLLQQINSSISNGIIVGPEFSRMIAEILLQHIDYEVYNSLVQSGMRKGIDYEICRYIDDIYIFVNEENQLLKIKNLFGEYSSKYQLKINELKSISGKLPYLWNEWKSATKLYLNNFFERTFYVSKDGKEYLLKAKNYTKIKNAASLKEEFQNMLALYPNYKEKIVSYVFSAIFNQMRRSIDKRMFRSKVTDEEIEKVLDFIFYIYSFSPTFRNTRKLICIEYLFEKEIEIERFKFILQSILKKYEYIFLNANLPDIVDLLLILGKNNLELSVPIEEHIWGKIVEQDNPILAANYLIYSNYNKKYFKRIRNEIEELIERKISIITNKNNALLYREIWWVFIFYNCPYLNEEIKTSMKMKIGLLSSNTGDIKPQLLSLIQEFLNENKFPNKFIDWDTDKDITGNITYLTYERTLFKNSLSNHEFDY
ncbi:RNA-directed DNA polymerase [Bacillus wiedmannii]|uniref:RNA-directed DNA polymerase n=1 Tax=Bacillus wiedmannii TaxID=1890302 RepID=UPI002E23776D|nr:RNA-directed DNA polymerase [Bacillus wiedmannii]